MASPLPAEFKPASDPNKQRNLNLLAITMNFSRGHNRFSNPQFCTMPFPEAFLVPTHPS
jgi:hypothetical protein